jgi:hypothetical protein
MKGAHNEEINLETNKLRVDSTGDFEERDEELFEICTKVTLLFTIKE